MKYWLPPAAILASLLLFCLWDANYMHQETLRWQDQLAQADHLAAEEDWARALACLEHSYQDWHSRWLYVHLVSSRDAVNDAEAMYHRATAFAQTQELTEFRAELADLRDQLRVLSDMESISLHNIL